MSSSGRKRLVKSSYVKYDMHPPPHMTCILWQDPLDEGLVLPVNTTIQVWKGSEDVARISALGHRVIVSSAEAWYLDCGHGSWVDGGRSWCDPYKVILKSPLCSGFI